MWLKNDGFYMADLLLSLAGWLLITSILVPSFMGVKKQTLQIQEKSAAYHILYEYIGTLLVENVVRENRTIMKENTRYELVWQGGGTEVCIRYEDVLGQTFNFCETVQQ